MRNVYLALLLLAAGCKGSEYAEESLILKVPNEDQLYAVFNFSVVSGNNLISHDGVNGRHYNLFPRNIGDLLQKYNVAEFHLSMSQGLWRYESWGYPYFPAPPGAQLWVWFQQDTENVDAAWRGFANALSGLLCASLNFIGKKETAIPNLSFRPEGVTTGVGSHLLRHAVLPRETLCTENLTPWLKLLPCGSNAGIASLFDPATLHHSQYLSLALNFKRTCLEPNCQELSMHLSQSVSTVFDLRKTSKGKLDFTVQGILNKNIHGACPVARKSEIKVSLPKNVAVDPVPDSRTIDGSNEVSIYDLTKDKKLHGITARWEENLASENPVTPLIGHCHLTGVGQQDGGTRCHLSNKADKNVSVVVMQTVPWFIQVYLHTLKVTDQNGKILPLKRMTFRPAKIRESPHFVEFKVSIPPSSTAVMSMQFTRGFLTWTEHPPDANHGFYIGSAVITVKNRDIGLKGSEDVHRIYTEAIQVIIPVPDFSMPYNVICLACTVVAIAFGSLHNLTTRIYQKVDPEKKESGLKAKLFALFSVLKPSKFSDKT